jgi:hypothetical protein
MPTGHQPCAPCVDASVACDSSVPRHRVRAASQELPCPRPANRRTTSCPCWRPACGRHRTLSGGSPPRTPAQPPTPATVRPDGVRHVAGRSGRGGRSIRRPVNPLTGPTRYNFLYSSSRPALRAASGRPPARQRHDGHRGAGLTLPPGHRRDAPASTYGLRPVPNSPARTPDGSRSRPRRRTRPGRSGTTPRTETARPIPRPPPSRAPGGSSSPRSVASTRRTARR